MWLELLIWHDDGKHRMGSFGYISTYLLHRISNQFWPNESLRSVSFSYFSKVLVVAGQDTFVRTWMVNLSLKGRD